MKKLTALFLTIILIFSMVGCNQPSTSNGEGNTTTENTNDENNFIKTNVNGESDATTAYCYVLEVTANGFVANINGVGDVFIKYANAKQHIEEFDTVIVEYYKANLIEKAGTYTDPSDEKATYSYTVASPISVRVADPSKGEPVFG